MVAGLFDSLSLMGKKLSMMQPPPKSGNVIKIRVDSKDSFDGASGAGTILRLRFRKIASGSSRLDFGEAHAYGASYNDNLLATHGGTLTVK